MHDEFSRPRPDNLRASVDANDPIAIAAFLSTVEPSEALHAIANLSDLDQTRLLQTLSDEDAAQLIDRLPEAQAAQMIERLSTAKAAGIVSELPSNEQAD